MIAMAGLLAILVVQGCAVPADWQVDAVSSENNGSGQPTYTPREGLSAQQRLQQVVNLLEGGDPSAARTELTLYLAERPNSTVGRDLLQQIDQSPQDYFPADYREVPLTSGQTLSNLSQRYLGSLYRFHALAKYNGIDQPRSLKAGQNVRIPLTERAREVFAAADAAVDPTIVVTAPEPSPPAADPAPPEPEVLDIDQLDSDALKAYRAQDLDTAISLWDQVLTENPEHENARLYRSQAVELKKALASPD
jgi:hypothetical protein